MCKQTRQIRKIEEAKRTNRNVFNPGGSDKKQFKAMNRQV